MKKIIKDISLEKMCCQLKELDQTIEIWVLHFINQVEKENHKEKERSSKLSKDRY